MRSIRPPLIALVIGAALFSALVFLVIVPQIQDLSAKRDRIDQNRSRIDELQAQQRNVTTVAKDYNALLNTQKEIDAQYLDDSKSVDFFNAIDQLVNDAQGSNSQLRVDTPVKGKAVQSLGMHISYTGSYHSMISVIRRLQGLPVLVTLTNVSISSAGSPPGDAITIDALLPWKATI